MTKRRLFIMLAVVAMAMSVMAPASAGKGNTGAAKAIGGWDCDNLGPNSYLHCARVDIVTWLGDSGPGNALSVLVYSEDGAEFLGTETLRVGREGAHHWHGGPNSPNS